MLKVNLVLEQTGLAVYTGDQVATVTYASGCILIEVFADRRVCSANSGYCVGAAQ